MDFNADLWLVLIAFAMSVVSGLVLIPWLRRLKAGQSILKYVDMHAAKAGTPTMGGLIFILPIILISMVFIGWDTPLSLMIVVTSCGYGIVGFLDDFLKIKHHQNLGLRPYQKIIGQFGIALLVSVFYLRINPTGEIWVPFFDTCMSTYFKIDCPAFKRRNQGIKINPLKNASANAINTSHKSALKSTHYPREIVSNTLQSIYGIF